VQFAKVGEELLTATIPPPPWLVVLPVNVQFVKVGEELPWQYIPPPPQVELLFVNVQFVTVGEELPLQVIPGLALFVNVQFVKVGEELSQSTPLVAPFFTVNPSNTDPESSPLFKVTTFPVPLPSIIVVAAPFSLLSVMAFPSKLMFSE
jgi:hypothetical protein